MGFMDGYPRTYELTMEDTAQNDRNLPNIMIGVCLTEVRSAYQRATDGFFELVGYGEYNYKPSIGTDGKFCQCVQITEPNQETIAVDEDVYNAKKESIALCEESKKMEKEDYIAGDFPTKYLISPHCERCDVNDDYSQQYGDKTVYNINPAAYGLFFGVRRPACDFEWDTMECKTCKWNQDGFMDGYPRTYELTMEDTAQNDRNLPNIMIGV